MQNGFELIRVDQLADASLGSRIAFFRKQRGLTQKDLARRVGVSQATVSRLESAPCGVPLRILDAVRKELNVTYADLTDSVPVEVNPQDSGALRVGDVMMR